MAITTETDSITGLTTVSSAGTGLSTTFKNQIETIMTYEKQPLELLQKQRDALTTRKTAYATIQTKLDTLLSATRALMTSSGYSSLGYSRAGIVTPTTTGTTVATVSVGSAAIKGTYNLSVTQLATSYVHASAVQSSSTSALGLTGSIVIGGNGTSSATEASDPGDHINAVSTSSVASGFTELGKDTYTVETRDNDGTLQFRLKDQDGNVVSIANQSDGGASLTSDWQDVTAGSYDTKRGLTIDFTGTGTAGVSATIDYVSAGTSISVSSSDSLVTIASNINNAVQPDGREITATVVNNQLVLTGPTGANNQIDFTDNVGLGFTQQQAGQNAEFSMNNIALSRESNTGLTDVVSGMTLNLAADAAGRSATITVTQDTSGAQSTIDTFIEKFNDLMDYINEQTAITEGDDGTYTRAALANDTVFSEMKSSLFDKILGQYFGSGDYSNLNEIGIGFDDDLKLTILDSDALESALESGFDSVVSLLDSAMSGVESMASGYTGSSGYISTLNSSILNEWTEMSDRIIAMQQKMITRKEQLTEQYAEMQATILALQYNYQSWSSIFSNTNAVIGSST